MRSNNSFKPNPLRGSAYIHVLDKRNKPPMSPLKSIAFAFFLLISQSASGADVALYSNPLESTSSVTGSRIKKVFLDNQTLYIESIDNLALDKPKKNWSKEYLVAPGVHTFVIAFHQGMIHETSTLRFEVRPNTKYRIAFDSTVKPMGADQHITYWLEDSKNGEKLSDPVRVDVRVPKIIIVPVYY